MMFMIGQGERTVAVGPVEPVHCPRCSEVTGFQPRLRYRYGQFDLLFGWVYGKRYELACCKCGHGWVLDREVAGRLYGDRAIPFRLRYGMPILAGLLVALWALVQAFGQAR